MGRARMLLGDVRDRLTEIPDGTIDLVLTSPPFLALRSYLPTDHPDKHLEIGSEATPAEFIDTLLGLTAEWRRVLAPHGSIAVELGDTMAGSGGGGGDYIEGGIREGQQQFAGSAAAMRESNAAHWRQKNRNRDAWPMPKSHTLVPELYRIGLAYGINPLTGTESPAGRWRIRNVVRWCRPNPPVGMVTDFYRRATSDIVVATLAADRWFDMDAVRVPPSPATSRVVRHGDGGGRNGDTGQYGVHPAGTPLLDWWNIPTYPYKGAHYATWPPELARRLILTMCPTKVCRTCGQPSRRIVETVNRIGKAVARRSWREDDDTSAMMHSGSQADAVWSSNAPSAVRNTVGWSDCGHDDWRPGHVIDPFAGTGTTGEIATGCGRDATLIDIDQRNIDLARQRIGMFLDADDSYD